MKLKNFQLCCLHCVCLIPALFPVLPFSLLHSDRCSHRASGLHIDFFFCMCWTYLHTSLSLSPPQTQTDERSWLGAALNISSTSSSSSFFLSLTHSLSHDRSVAHFPHFLSYNPLGRFAAKRFLFLLPFPSTRSEHIVCQPKKKNKKWRHREVCQVWHKIRTSFDNFRKNLWNSVGRVVSIFWIFWE